MTVTEAAAHFGVSRSTIYRRIKRGELAAHKVGRRWVIDLDKEPVVTQQPAQGWHPQVHRRFAEKDGLTPADFTWQRYPVSNVRLELPVASPGQNWTLLYLADIPPETPQTNQYVKADERVEGQEYEAVQFGDETWYDPKVRGTALSRVKFSLIDLADHEVLHDSATGHEKGEVRGGIAEGHMSLLWNRLKPSTTLRVRLEAIGLFFPYNDPETGSGGTEYSNVNNGYLGSDIVTTGEHELTMTPHGLPEPPHLLLDGKPAPEPEEFQLKGAAEGQPFHEWLTEQRQMLTAKDDWLTARRIAGQVGMKPDRYAQIEAGDVTPEDWERANIEDVIKGWQQHYDL